MFVASALLLAYLIQDVTPAMDFQRGGKMEMPKVLVPTAWVEVVGESGKLWPVVPGAQRMHMLTLRFFPGCSDDRVLESVKLFHKGAGDPRDLIAVYALSGGRRVSRGKPLEQNGSVTVQFRSLILPACTWTEITFSADIASHADAGGIHQLAFLDSDDVQASGAQVQYNKPRFRISRRTTLLRVGKREIQPPPSAGMILAEFLDMARRPTFGPGRVVGYLRLSNDWQSDVELWAVTMRNVGTARGDDLMKLSLEDASGKKVTKVNDIMDGEHIRLVFDPPLRLKKGKEVVFTLRGDVHSRESMRLVIEEESDIETKPLF